MKTKLEQEEYRRFRRLDILSKIGWLFSYRIFRHPKHWLERKPEEFHGEPPLVSLARLAEEGLQENRERLDKENLDRVVELFATVIKKDDIISEQETEVVRKFILEHGYDGVSDQDIAEYISSIENYSVHLLRLKNALHLLKKNTTRDQIKGIVATLYRLAHLHGVESVESRKVADYAVQLGLSFTEIRHITVDIKTETEEEDNGNIRE